MKNILKQLGVSAIKFGIVFVLMFVFINRFPTEYHEIAENVLRYILYCYLISMIIWVIYKLIFYLGSNKATQDLKKEQLTDLDLKKYKEYYREILTINCPLVLGYIDNF